MNAPTGLVPPNDLDAEAAVLSAIMLDPAALSKLSGLRPADFFSDANRLIFAACLELAATDIPIDVVSVVSRLRDDGHDQVVGGARYLAQLVDATPAVAHVEHHAAIVREKAHLRRVIAVSQHVAARGYEGEDASGMLAELVAHRAVGRGFTRLGVDAIYAAREPIPWLVRDVDIAPGAPTLLCGYGFSGKSIAAQALGVAVASDMEAAWDLLTVRHGRVLHLDYEQGARLTLDRYRRIAVGMGLGPEDLAGRLDVVALPSTYLDEQGTEDLLVRELDACALCIIDPFRGAAPSVDENCSRDVRRVLDVYTRVSERTGCVILNIHHARKPQKDSAGGARMAIRGSGDFYAGHGSVLIFDAPKAGPITVSHDKARLSGQLHKDFTIHINDTEDGALRVVGSPATASTDVGADRVMALQARVVEVLREHPGASGRRLRSLLGGTARTVDDAVALLVEDGVVRRTQGQHNGAAFYLMEDVGRA